MTNVFAMPAEQSLLAHPVFQIEIEVSRILTLRIKFSRSGMHYPEL
jgi:hypothetical protein